MIHEVSSIDDLNNLLNSPKPSIVLIHAPSWCQPCIRFHPHFEKVSENLEQYDFAQIDVDNSDPTLMQIYEVKSVPTVAVHDSNGLIVAYATQRVGPKFQKELEELLD